MKLKSLNLFIFSTLLFFQPMLCVASSLILKIDSSTKIYKDHNQFELSVTFYNASDKPIIVFPAYLRRKYTPLGNHNVHFNPYPGPVIDPWRTAIILTPRESKSIRFKGMRNGDGLWSLEPGKYTLSVSLDVATTFSYYSLKKKFKGIDIWRGSVESESIEINYLNEP
jgi:hypothetical protein